MLSNRFETGCAPLLRHAIACDELPFAASDAAA